MNTIAPSSPNVPEEPRRSISRSRWVRVAAWITAGLMAASLILIFSLIVALRSMRVHSYVLNTLQNQASERLGTRIELQNFVLHPSTLSLDLYGITVRGADPFPNSLLLQVAHVGAGVRIVSIIHREWYLDSFEIDDPVVNVITDANGNTNIPKLKGSGGGSNTSVFDLGVRHATLTKGEVFYNDRQSAFAADLHDVEFRSAFEGQVQKYSGTLSYADGHLTAGSLHTFPHSLSAKFDATPSTFHISNARLTTGASQIEISATVQNYNDPDVQAQYDAVIEGGDVRRILGNASVPTGVVRAAGSVRYHAIPNRALLDVIVLTGNLSSQQIDVQMPTVRARISDIAAQYSLAGGNAVVSSLHARLLGGELTAGARMDAIRGDTHSQLNASLRRISLAQLQGMIRGVAIPGKVSLSGGLNGQVNASWGKTFDNLTARADAVVDGRVSGGSGVSSDTVIPLNSTLHGRYSAVTQEVALEQSSISTPQTSLSMNGVMSRRSKLALQFQSNDLHELETIADIFTVPTAGQPSHPLGLGGTASFNGTLSGSTALPHLTGQLVASNVHVRGTEWRVLRTSLDISPSLARLQDAHLEPASRGHILLSASAGLEKWAFTNVSPIEVGLEASELDVAELTKIAGAQIPITGTLALNVTMHGTELHPVGQGNITLSHITAYDEPIRSAQLTFAGTGDEVRGNLGLSLPAGKLEGTFSVRPQEKSYVAELAATDVRIEKFQTVKAKNLGASGGLNLHVSGRGTFENPQLDARLQIAKLEMQKQAINEVNLQLNLANRVATATLSSRALNTSIRANARVNLAGDYLADATLDTQGISLQPLAAIYAPDQSPDITGETELHATLHGPLKNRKMLEAHLRVPLLKMAYGGSVQLAAATPILADYKDGVISLQRGTIRGTDTDLQFQGSIPISSTAPMSLLLLGTVNLHLAQLFNADIRSSGQLKFKINSYGASSDPNVQGQVEIVDANIASGDIPVGLQHGNGVLTLTKDRLYITKFQGTVGGGVLTAQGGISYRPDVQFDLGLSAKGVRLLYPQGVREGVDADIRLAGTTDNAVLGGAVNISELSFTPAFDLTNFINQFSGGVTAPPSQGLTQNVQLNLSVHSSNNISLVSRTLSVNGTANLQVRGTAAQPVILGRINLDSGDLIFNGDRFVLNGGTIQFVNPSETQPVVNLALNTNIQQYSIYMRFSGPIEQLHTDYASDPSLPAADIINLLAFGKTTEANSPDAATPANQAAESLVASQVSSQVTSRVSKIAGISQLSIDPVLGGGSSQGPPGANVTIQQRVSGNLFVTFSTNVASTQNQTIMGQYQISPRVAVSATRDQNGGFAIDTTIKKTW